MIAITDKAREYILARGGHVTLFTRTLSSG
jgi:hypothetical protein